MRVNGNKNLVDFEFEVYMMEGIDIDGKQQLARG
jgi:hypothetical protein